MNLYEFNDLNDYMNILNNLCIYITYFYSIILILDELYNIGIFTFKYTYNYNYGTATENFNTINTIEYETNRFKTYDNINFIKTDIFNNSYFNYVITVFITLITIISCISYGIFFYFKIINNNLFCKYDIDDELMSLPKRFLKCICNDCHKILPNCSFNYLILMMIIIIIPFTYIIKLFLKYDYTPTSNTSLMIIIIVLFSYIYNIYMNNINKDIINIIKEILIFIFFSIIFIISIIIHKNIYDTYNNPSLNNNLKDEYIMYDIYKQAPPNKPSSIPLPIFDGVNLLKNFNYVDGGDNRDVNYDKKKQLLEKYYSDKKEYDKAIQEYNIKNDIYNSSIEKQKLKLDDKIYFFDVMFNILGIKNKLNITIIVLIILLYGLYYYFNDELFLSGMIYLITVLILITLINAITYYNTYLNKYIIYEPSSYYKNDLTIANTKLNMYFNPGNGDNFYNILNNNSSINYNINDNLNKNNIINSIKSLTNISNFNNDNMKMILTNIDNFNKLNTINYISKNNELDGIIYYKFFVATSTPSITNPLVYLFSKINSIHIINKSNQIDNFKIINSLKLNFSSKSYEIYVNYSNYYAYIYYKLYYYQSVIYKLLENNYRHNKTELINLYDSLEKLINLLKPYKINVLNNNTKITDDTIFINNNIETAIKNAVNNSITFILTDTTYYNSVFKKIKNLLFNYDNNISNIYFENVISEDAPTAINNLSLSITGITSLTINNPISRINTQIIQPSIKPSTYNYYELPNKINDNNNNDIIIKITDSTFRSKDNILFYINNKIDKTIDYKIKSSYIDDNDNTNTIKFNNDKINIFPSEEYNISSSTTITSTQIYIPSKLYKISNIDPSLKLKKIIYNVLYNNLVNITYQFNNIDLQKLFDNSDTILNTIKFYSYSSLFKLPSINNYNLSNLEQFILSITDADTDITNTINVLGFIILLYNIYNSNINKLLSTIEYLVYMQKSNTNSHLQTDFSIFKSNNDDLVKELEIIETKIIKPKNSKDYDKNNYIDKDLIRYYEKNKYNISLILNIYSNIFSNIKNVISTIDRENLCFSSNDKYTIEKNLYSHIIKYYNLSSLPLIASGTPATRTRPATITTIATIKLPFLNRESRKKLLDINKQLINFFKIINYLFDNLINNENSNINDIAKIQDEIIKNYNFYNPELYNNIKEFIKKEISINCNYVNKYNNLETSKLDLFKYNCENVAYNFPVLIIIFIVILGEGFFIKS